MTNLQNQSGRSMIEMLGVLAIIGVLSVGGIAGYSKAMLKYKTNKTIDQITMLTTNIRTLYAQQKVFTGLAEASAVNMGVVPDEMIGSTTGPAGAYTAATLNNPFSGTVTITVDNSVPGDAGANRAFIIGVNGIPKEACMAVAVSDWGSNYSSGLIGMGVYKTGAASEGLKASDTTGIYAGASCATTSAATAGTGAYCAKDLPISVADAAKGCDCNGSECSVAFKYY